MKNFGEDIIKTFYAVAANQTAIYMIRSLVALYCQGIADILL